MSRGRRRARELHDEASRVLAAQDLPERVRLGLSNARSIATLSQMLYEAGHPDRGEALSIAEQARADALLRAMRPDAERGAKIAASARAGHEAVYGTDEEKAERWRAMAGEYRAAIAAGAPKTLAREAVAARHNVSAKTVQRAAKKF